MENKSKEQYKVYEEMAENANLSSLDLEDETQIDKKKLSPMMQQYFEIKEAQKGAILLYRLGDFYECFFNDAKVVSRALDIVLTGRQCGLDDRRAPMCGIPAHAVDSYVAKLIKLGYRVAICEQMLENQSKKNKMMDREVKRIVTAGTAIEDEILDSNKNNYLLCIMLTEENIERAQCAISYIDISTGDFACLKLQGNLKGRIVDELVRISPSEILCNTNAYNFVKKLTIVEAGNAPKPYRWEEWAFEINTATEELKSSYKVDSLDAMDISGDNNLISVCGATLAYLNRTQKLNLAHLKMPKIEQKQEKMYLDAGTIRNLELVQRMRDGKQKNSLLDVLDHTKTAMGARLLKRIILNPLQNKEEIDKRLYAVKELIKNSAIRLTLSRAMEGFADMERLIAKVNFGTIMPKDMYALGQSLSNIDKVKPLLLQMRSPLLQWLKYSMSDMNKISQTIERAIEPESPATLSNGGFIRYGFSRILDDCINMKKHGNEMLNALKDTEIQATGIKNLKIKYNKVFGYFIEVPISAAGLIPPRYTRKQTVSGFERYVTPELKEIEDGILNSEERSIEIEQEIYEHLKKDVLASIDNIQTTSQAIAELDVLLSFASVSEKNGYVEPTITLEQNELKIVAGRHPVVEKILNSKNFISNDCFLNNKERIAIITGPNMAGKSTYMRSVALITLMAHIGCFVPANEAIIPITDRIFTRVGASDDLSYGQSTFMVEMIEVANILNNATNSSLIILDEVGRGTSTYDGLSIAWSIMQYLSETLKAKTLFATHYFELTELEGMLEGVINYRVSAKETQDSVIFLRKVIRGSASRSFGIQVASLAGVPSAVTNKAKEVLKKLEVKQNINIKDVDNVQLDMFTPTKEDKIVKDIISQIESVDINNITPLMALEILTNIKDKLSQ